MTVHSLHLSGATQLLTYALLSDGDFDEAVGAGKQALMYARQIFGEDSTEAAAAMVNLCTALVETGKLGEETEALLRRAQDIYALTSVETSMSQGKEKTEYSPEYVHTTLMLGTLYLFREDIDKAEMELRLAAKRGGFLREGEDEEDIGLRNFPLF